MGTRSDILPQPSWGSPWWLQNPGKGAVTAWPQPSWHRDLLLLDSDRLPHSSWGPIFNNQAWVTGFWSVVPACLTIMTQHWPEHPANYAAAQKKGFIYPLSSELSDTAWRRATLLSSFLCSPSRTLDFSFCFFFPQPFRLFLHLFIYSAIIT